jgi:LmbE family N-acetylglucosaminyl deacetylase
MSPTLMNDDFSTYMLVVAHPDDSEFSSAGTVARLTDAGKRVIVIQVTSGDRGSPDRNAIPAQVGRHPAKPSCRKRPVASASRRSSFSAARTASCCPISHSEKRSCG